MANEVGYIFTVAGQTVVPNPQDPVDISLSAPLEIGLTSPQQFTEVTGTENAFANPDQVTLSLSASEVGKDITYTGGNVVTPFARTITFKVNNNYTAGVRKETIRASVPFAPGQVETSDLDNLVVSGHETAWLPLQYWPSGNSVKIAQAQFTDTLDGESGEDTRTYSLASAVGMAMQGSFQRHPSVTGYDLGAMVRDRFDVSYLGFISGAGEVMQSTPLVETKFYRTYHEVSAGQTGIQRDGNPRDFLASNFYVTEFKDMPLVVVDWIIANDYLGADSPSDTGDPNLYPLGAIDVNKASFLASGMNQIYAYRASKDNLVWESVGPTGHINWGALQNDYIGDRQTRRYRFILRWYVNNSVENEIAKTTATAIQQYPMYALANPVAWRDSSAFGLLGGPIAGPADSLTRSQAEYNSFENNGYHFGTWGIKGLPNDTNTGGTPINEPFTDKNSHAIQANNPDQLVQTEQMAWSFSVRPFHYHGFYERDIQNSDLFQMWGGWPVFAINIGEKLGRQVYHDERFTVSAPGPGGEEDPIWIPNQAIPYRDYKDRVWNYGLSHNVNAWDAEHFSMDHMFEYYTLTGDPWAKEAIKNMATQAKGAAKIGGSPQLYTYKIYSTRAEGLLSKAWAQAYEVSRDESFRDYAIDRAEHVQVEGRTTDSHKPAITWENHTGDLTVDWREFQYLGAIFPFPGPGKFYIPWQHAHILHGCLGAYNSFEASANPSALLSNSEIAIDAIQNAWVSAYVDSYWGYVPDGVRYYVFTEGPSAFGASSQLLDPSAYDFCGPGGNGVLFSLDPSPNPGGTSYAGLQSTTTFLPGPLRHLKNYTQDASYAARADVFADKIIWYGSISDNDRWNTWYSMMPVGDDT